MEFPAERLLSGIQRPLAKALKSLQPRWPQVEAGWRELMGGLALSDEEINCLATLNFSRERLRLQAGNFGAYRLAVERAALDLGQRGIAEAHSLASLAFYLESCLGHTADGLRDSAPRRALVRLASATQLFVLAGYATGRASDWRCLDHQERQRLSRDLHDEIGHTLVVLKLYLEMMAMDLDKGDTPNIGQKLSEALDLVSQGVQSVRRLILDLGPALLEEAGFLPAVKQYARQFSTRTGIKVEVKEAGIPDNLPAPCATALYRVLQGALSNVVKHAKARQVKITLGSMKHSVLVMVIEDDGVGFAASERPARGFGLTAMRDRIEGLGGRFYIESRPGSAGRNRGTRIEVDLPVYDDAA